MKYRLLNRRVTLAIYDKDDVNYVASCQININGNKGTIDTINGRDFYKIFQEYGLQPFRDLELIEIAGYVSKSNYRLIQKIFKNIAKVQETTQIYKINDIELVWIIIPIT